MICSIVQLNQNDPSICKHAVKIASQVAVWDKKSRAVDGYVSHTFENIIPSRLLEPSLLFICYSYFLYN